MSVPFDFLTNEQSLIDIYFIANSVTNLQSGMYYYNKLENNIEQLKEGDFGNNQDICVIFKVI